MILVYVTHSSKKAAEKICKHLIKKKLIGCANIFPIKSLYPWKGKTASEKEYVSILKTTTKKYSSMEKEIIKIHPYKVPCIIKIKIGVNKTYKKWIKNNLD